MLNLEMLVLQSTMYRNKELNATWCLLLETWFYPQGWIDDFFQRILNLPSKEHTGLCTRVHEQAHVCTPPHHGIGVSEPCCWLPDLLVHTTTVCLLIVGLALFDLSGIPNDVERPFLVQISIAFDLWATVERPRRAGWEAPALHAQSCHGLNLPSWISFLKWQWSDFPSSQLQALALSLCTHNMYVQWPREAVTSTSKVLSFFLV